MQATRFFSDPCPSITDVSNFDNCVADLHRVEQRETISARKIIEYSEVIDKINLCWETLSDSMKSMLFDFHACLCRISETMKFHQQEMMFWDQTLEESSFRLQLLLNRWSAPIRLIESTDLKCRDAAEMAALHEEKFLDHAYDPQLQAISRAIIETCCEKRIARTSPIQLAHVAFQEIISDFYLYFSRSINPEDISIPPIAAWSEDVAEFSTYPAESNRVNFCFDAAVVEFPKHYAKGGILAWGCLGHEVAGHDILHHIPGLLQELMDVVEEELEEQNIPTEIIDYWKERIDETASDILAILHMGPSAAFAQIGFFRHFDHESRLTCAINPTDEHPANILRGFLAAQAVRILGLKSAEIINGELENDIGWKCHVEMTKTSKVFDLAIAQYSASIVAETILERPLASLQNRSFSQIRKWGCTDEKIVSSIRQIIQRDLPLNRLSRNQFHAAHIVAAAILESIEGEKTRQQLQYTFQKMLELLRQRHLGNNLFWKACPYK